MMPLSEVVSFFAESFIRMLGAVCAVLFGFGYLGRFTGNVNLQGKPVRLAGLVVGIGLAIGGSAAVRSLVGS